MSAVRELFHNLGNSHNVIIVGAEVIKESLRECLSEQNSQRLKEKLQQAISDFEQLIKSAYESDAITCRLHEMVCPMIDLTGSVCQDNSAKEQGKARLKKRLKLLIVDDEEAICNLGQSYFAKCDFDTHAAYTGLNALRLARKIKPDIAIIDMYLGNGPDGIEIIKMLSKMYPQCKCILITWDKTKASQALAAGAAHFHRKPIKLAELEKSIHSLLYNCPN